MTKEKRFIAVMLLLVGIMGSLFIGMNIAASGKNVNITNFFLFICNLFFILFIATVFFSMIVSSIVLKDKKINKSLMKTNFRIIRILYPLMITFRKIVNIPKSDIRKVYVALNNKYIYAYEYDLKPEEIMVLTPHCIQKSFCKHKITNHIENCGRCGKCNVADLIKLKEKYGVKAFVATGGTLARKIILDNKPKAVISVACERDLTSGIQDVSKLPVIGIFNKRPHGPCFDTEMDTLEVEKAIKFFLGGN